MRSFYKFIVVILIIALGLGIAVALIKTKPKAKRRPVSIAAPLVDVILAGNHTEDVVINATGTVIPAREVALQSQVSGSIIWQSSKLVPGALIKEGDEIVRIDDRDYRLALEQQKATLTRAEVDLETEKARIHVAEREWKLLESDIEITDEGRKLALREPQIKNAKANLEAARSALAKAELDLERTVIRSPFNAIILTEMVDVGQIIGPGSIIATLAGSDTFRIQASVPVHQLGWINFPKAETDIGSPVKIIQGTSGLFVVRHGTLERLLGEVDPKGRMARLLINVPDPLGGEIPLLLGEYLRVEITGRTVDHVAIIPREALREGRFVWLLNDDHTLKMQEVDVIWSRRDDVFVRKLNPGDLIIKNRITTPVEGMALKLNTTVGSTPEGVPGGEK